jgi:hypothetical protein
MKHLREVSYKVELTVRITANLKLNSKKINFKNPIRKILISVVVIVTACVKI